MLPWLVAVLVLLNVGLFFWGYDREKTQEPPSIPVPEGKYEIRLIGEGQEESRQVADSDDEALSSDGEADDAPLAREQSGEASADEPPAAGGSGRLDKAAVGTKGVAAGDAEASAPDRTAKESEPESVAEHESQPGEGAELEPEVAEARNGDTESEPGTRDKSSTEGATMESESAAPDEIADQRDSVDPAVSGEDEETPVSDETSQEAAGGDVDSAESAAKPGVTNSDGLSSDELEVDAPGDAPDVATPNPKESPETP